MPKPSGGEPVDAVAVLVEARRQGRQDWEGQPHHGARVVGGGASRRGRSSQRIRGFQPAEREIVGRFRVKPEQHVTQQ